MPLSPHRCQRWYRVLCGPYPLAASFQSKPLRLMKAMPLNTCRSSLSVLPCQPVNARLAMGLWEVVFKTRHLRAPQPGKIRPVTARFRTLTHATRRKSIGLIPEYSQCRRSAGSKASGTSWKQTGRNQRRIAIVPTDVAPKFVDAG